MELQSFTPRFTLPEELHRMVVKHLPGKMMLFDRFQKVAGYTAHVPTFYTLLTPLFQLIYGSNNVHAGYFERGDEDWIDAQHALTRLLGQRLELAEKHKVLEVGCGIGGPAVTMTRSFGCHVTGLNITKAHIRRAKMHVRYNDLEDRVSFIHGNALQMPIEDARFDHAYAIESVSHMPDKARVISEVARVVRPGGRFGIIDGIAEDPEALYACPDFNFFNVTWGVRAEEWIRPNEIPRGLAAHGFRLIEERDLRGLILPTPLTQLAYAERWKKKIVDLYGEEVFQLTIRSLRITHELIDKGWLGYRMWIGQKTT